MTQPDPVFRAETGLNPVLLKKFPEQEIENINMKSKFMLISDELENKSNTSTQRIPQVRVNNSIESYNKSRVHLAEANSYKKLTQTVNEFRDGKKLRRGRVSGFESEKKDAGKTLSPNIRLKRKLAVSKAKLLDIK